MLRPLADAPCVAWHHQVMSTPAAGVAMAVAMAALSGAAGVYTELIMKRMPKRNVNVQNIYLCADLNFTNFLSIYVSSLLTPCGWSVEIRGKSPQSAGTCSGSSSTLWRSSSTTARASSTRATSTGAAPPASRLLRLFLALLLPISHVLPIAVPSGNGQPF